ncbi:transporter [Tenacibaculum sp. IB213877]|uniref:transporter n=1 Tax=Tenacibaculum sp. IB213877 TaxID=3097351 RepID=UPI002A5AE37C|nr:transporter [Tenacibaculum sp. IB213877]MDY0780518.1 transporter [Tenacibaculum sp. IB213877]
MKNLLMMNDLKNNKPIFLMFFLIFSIKTIAINPFPSDYRLFLEDCDACGCSNNGGSLGMGGVIDNNFIGVRYLYQKYVSKDGIFSNSPEINEFFNTTQVWSKIPINEKIEIQAFIPFHFHSREYIDRTTSISGLGDISLFANYVVINKQSGNYNEETDKVSSTNHLLKIGGGIKLPTGKYNEEISNSINPSFQLGTGSVDYIANLQYIYKYNSFGINNYINYYYKTANSKDYKFGNQFNFNSTFFYVLKDAKKRAFVPSLGFSGEFYEKNEVFNLPESNTEGYALFTSLGIEYNTKNITVGTQTIFPIQQSLAKDVIKVKYRSSIYINYNF